MIGISSQSKLTLAAVALLSSVVISFAQETTRPDGARPAQSTSTVCAERYLQLFTLIDALGEIPQFAGEKLFKALLATMQAHEICAGGQVNKALSLYEAAVLNLVLPVGSSE